MQCNWISFIWNNAEQFFDLCWMSNINQCSFSWSFRIRKYVSGKKFYVFVGNCDVPILQLSWFIPEMITNNVVKLSLCLEFCPGLFHFIINFAFSCASEFAIAIIHSTMSVPALHRTKNVPKYNEKQHTWVVYIVLMSSILCREYIEQSTLVILRNIIDCSTMKHFIYYNITMYVFVHWFNARIYLYDASKH